MKNKPSFLDLNHLRDELVTLKVVVKKETVDDPYEKNKIVSIAFNPKYIKGIVREIDGSRLVWELYGLKEKGAIELICDKKYKSLLKKASTLEYKDESYVIYKSSRSKKSKITQKDNYLVIVLERS